MIGHAAAITLCTFTLYERTGYARNGDYVTIPVPLAEADNIYNVSQLQVQQSGSPIDATFVPVSRWWGLVTDTTRPLKMVHVTFRANLTANQIDSSTYALTNGGGGNPSGGIQVTSTANYYDIVTGTADGSGHFRIRKTAGGGHNLLEYAAVVAGGVDKVICATANTSSLYLHGVATAAGPLVAQAGTIGTISGGQLNNGTLIVTVNGVDSTFTFAASAPTTVAGVVAAIQVAWNRGAGALTWSARFKDNTYSTFMLTCKAGQTCTVKGGTVMALLGFTAGQPFVGVSVGQNADYDSKDYTGGSYAVAGIETPSGNVTSLSGGETCTLLISGKFGAIPFGGQLDEAYLGSNSASGVDGYPTPVADLTYEARYTFYRNSAYVGIDVMWMGPGGTQNNYQFADAAVKNGGLRFVPNFNGAGTKLYATCYDTTNSIFQDASASYASGTSYVFNSASPTGTAYAFALQQSGFTFAGVPNELREGWFGIGDSTADRYMVLMHEDQPKYQRPFGFKYDGTSGFIELWPAQSNEVALNYTDRPYHIFMGMYYKRWRGGVLFGSGALSAATCRSAWYRLCYQPILAHCQSKYETSKVFLDLPPAQNIVKGSDNVWYKCILDHVASASNKPITGGSYATYWSALGWTPGDTTLAAWQAGRRYSSHNFGDVGPGGLDEAKARHLKWRDAMLDTTLPFQNKNYAWAADNMNGGNTGNNGTVGYDFYNWHAFGSTIGGNGTGVGNQCNGGRYGVVERFMNHWMVSGDPLHYDWMRRTTNHLIGPCILHPPQTVGIVGLGNGSQGPWAPYQEGGPGNGELHGPGFGEGALISVHSYDWRAWMYLWDAYTPYKTAMQMTRTFYCSNPNGLSYMCEGIGFSGSPVITAGSTYQYQTIRDVMWPMQAWLIAYLVYGDTAYLQFARNVFENGYVYNGDLCVTAGSSVDVAGGLGGRMDCAGWNQDTSFTVHTYQSYPQDAVKLFHEIGLRARDSGQGSIVSQADLRDAERYLIQATKHALTGFDGLSPNDASTLVKRTDINWPVLRGGSDSAGVIQLLCGSYAWRWSTNTADGNVAANVWAAKCTDKGAAAALSTAIDGLTVTVSGTSLTFSGNVPYSMGVLSHGNSSVPPPNGFYFYVTADGPSKAVQIATHAGGTATATLASSYTGTTGAGLNFTVAVDANITLDIWLTSLDAWAYAAKLYKQRGDTARYNVLLERIQTYYKHVMLYAPVTADTRCTWAATFTDTGHNTIREPVQIGTQGPLERECSYYTRRSGHTYLTLEKSGWVL